MSESENRNQNEENEKKPLRISMATILPAIGICVVIGILLYLAFTNMTSKGATNVNNSTAQVQGITADDPIIEPYIEDLDQYTGEDP